MEKHQIICGIDEAGRGPWAGPVCAGAVILDLNNPIDGLNDSKKLSEKKRNALLPLIKEKALAWSIGWASPQEIDELNIRQANHLAMKRAFDGLSIAPSLALVDGNDAPPLACKVETLIGGDGIEACISAASILAKTARDAKMIEYDEAFPEYGFAKHKGYGVKAHSEALNRLGPCSIHRMSFKPVAKAVHQHRDKAPL
ncbi:ribonuclease HII [Hirschia maritima]|uniref:ribonuclease HII n=1 Tax=Hirschia maritima TaxID=1121961 RepID=UPI00035C2A71|nr:ribonuclease HII [Hirschia maritima]